jgi:alpha-L-fucosidase
VTEFITRGWQTTRDNVLYLIIRFWDGRPELRLADLTTPIKRAELLTTGQILPFEQEDSVVTLRGLPNLRPTSLFPVIKLTCTDRPISNQWGRERLWEGDPMRIAEWARQRGTSVNVDGQSH